ncbi:MAG: DNA-binding response regulator [Cryomorphaceae bacterium]|nr:MAG: DNA-binding response regulator [Cryomorphaceae bacterium]
MSTGKRILLVEDDPVLHANICDALKAESLDVISVYDGQIAEKMLQRDSFHCVILDINLPGKNGLELCRDLRQRDKKTLVLMLTAFGELDDKVSGYEAGADDYLTKPFYMRELVLKLQALLKRSDEDNPARSQEQIVVGDLTITPSTAEVSRQGKEISLTPREYQILLKLTERPGELVSKKELIQKIWGRSIDINTNTVEVYINFLRNKVDKPFGRSSIKTKVGYGYYFEVQ